MFRAVVVYHLCIIASWILVIIVQPVDSISYENIEIAVNVDSIKNLYSKIYHISDITYNQNINLITTNSIKNVEPERTISKILG